MIHLISEQQYPIDITKSENMSYHFCAVQRIHKCFDIVS